VNLRERLHERLSRRSIRALLIALLLPGIVLLLIVDSWNDYETLAEVTKEAYDNGLVEPARVLESSVDIDAVTGDARLSAPLYGQAMLESRAGLRKYFGVEIFDKPRRRLEALTRQQGKLIAGVADLPRPDADGIFTGQPYFYDAVYRNDPVRVVVLSRDIYRSGAYKQVVVMVAESMGRRDEVENLARRKEVTRDLRMLALVAILVWLGVAWAMSPLSRLRAEVLARSDDDLTPLDAKRVPAEVVPLVDAVNHHIERHRKVLDEQARFLADASHQLRTPMAIMLTQAQYALREKDPAHAREGLTAVVAQLRRTRRLTEQLLSLAHASQHEVLPQDRHDMRLLARQVVLQYWPLAREKQQDLGLDETGDDNTPVWVAVSDVEVHEALSNLVHNAIHYAPVGATITVSVKTTPAWIELAVVDNGPGVAVDMRERVFDRFERADAIGSAEAGGSGLGLAIARAYARRNRGDIVLRDGEPNAAGTHGLAAVLMLRNDPKV